MKTKEFEIAELIGILLGDGGLGSYKSGNKTQHRLKISLNSIDDTEYVPYVAGLIEKVTSTSPTIRYRKKENTVDICAFGYSVLERFDRIGLSRSPKWNRAKIPKEYMKGKKSIFVLRGYFDTDGSVVITNNNGIIYPRLEMKVCPSPMQNQFIEILDKLGFRFGSYNIGKGKIRLQLNGISQLKKWKDVVGFSNPKHQKRAKNKNWNYSQVV